jgi:hypothetical protein
MKALRRHWLRAALALAALASGAGLALAGDGFLMIGEALLPGEPMAGAGYALDGGVETGSGRASGGAYSLAGGYWGEVEALVLTTFLPAITR